MPLDVVTAMALQSKNGSAFLGCRLRVAGFQDYIDSGVVLPRPRLARSSNHDELPECNAALALQPGTVYTFGGTSDEDDFLFVAYSTGAALRVPCRELPGGAMFVIVAR